MLWLLEDQEDPKDTTKVEVFRAELREIRSATTFISGLTGNASRIPLFRFTPQYVINEGFLLNTYSLEMMSTAFMICVMCR